MSRQNSFSNTKQPKQCSRSPSLKQNQLKCCTCSGRIPSPSNLVCAKQSLITSSTSPLRSSLNEDARQLRRERDELQVLLDKFEHHMAEIQSNVKVLTNERDKYIQMYEDTRSELQQTRKDMLKTTKNQNSSLAVQSILKRVEMERDTAVCDLRNLTNEMNSVRDRLKVITKKLNIF